MTIPDQLVIYCIICLLIVVIFCCCFHVIELIKLGYLKRKLTSPHRYSLSAISTQFSDDTGTGDSRLSTRRNSAITTADNPTPPTTTSTTNNTGGVAGNFSIITVFTYTSTTGQSTTASEHEHQPLTHQSCQVESQESKEPLEEASSSSSCHSTGNGGNERSEGGYANRNLMDLMDDPPNYYTALFPK